MMRVLGIAIVAWLSVGAVASANSDLPFKAPLEMASHGPGVPGKKEAAPLTGRLMEEAIRELTPAPRRCGTSPLEELFYCRYETSSGRSVVLELSASPDGPAGSLTYDYDDEEGGSLLDILGRFLALAGVYQSAFNDCVHRALWQSGDMTVGDLRVGCRRAELGDRVTYEVFTLRR
jgi:hypothetical protein